MIALTVDRCRDWLATSGLSLDKNLRFDLNAFQHRSHYYLVRGATTDLADLCRRLLDWLPARQERVLLVSQWETYPPDRLHIFNVIRKGCGASEPLLSVPGHAFLSTKQDGVWYDDRPQIDVEEESTAMWLMGMMLSWEWEGFVFAKGCRDVIWLGDGFIRLFTADPTRHLAGNVLLSESGLKHCSSFPWQSR